MNNREMGGKIEEVLTKEGVLIKKEEKKKNQEEKKENKSKDEELSDMGQKIDKIRTDKDNKYKKAKAERIKELNKEIQKKEQDKSQNKTDSKHGEQIKLEENLNKVFQKEEIPKKEDDDAELSNRQKIIKEGTEEKEEKTPEEEVQELLELYRTIQGKLLEGIEDEEKEKKYLEAKEMSKEEYKKIELKRLQEMLKQEGLPEGQEEKIKAEIKELDELTEKRFEELDKEIEKSKIAEKEVSEKIKGQKKEIEKEKKELPEEKKKLWEKFKAALKDPKVQAAIGVTIVGSSIICPAIGLGYGSLGLMTAKTAGIVWSIAGGGSGVYAGFNLRDAIKNRIKERKEIKKKPPSIRKGDSKKVEEFKAKSKKDEGKLKGIFKEIGGKFKEKLTKRKKDKGGEIEEVEKDKGIETDGEVQEVSDDEVTKISEIFEKSSDVKNMPEPLKKRFFENAPKNILEIAKENNISPELLARTSVALVETDIQNATGHYFFIPGTIQLIKMAKKAFGELNLSEENIIEGVCQMYKITKKMAEEQGIKGGIGIEKVLEEKEEEVIERFLK